jgi:hypothetical protein
MPFFNDQPTLRLRWLILACLLAGGLMFASLQGPGGLAGLVRAAADGFVVLCLLGGSAGLGWLAVRWLIPADAPWLLRGAACGQTGLWLLAAGTYLLGQVLLPDPWVIRGLLVLGLAVLAWRVRNHI